jgi:hypothetical protein
VFIVCDKEVGYSDAKKKELHVFPQPESSMLPATSIGVMKKLADQVLERVRKRMTSAELELEMRKSFRCFHFLLKFIEQKSAGSVNFSLTVTRMFVSQASCEFLILRNCGMKGGITHASKESSGKESGS